MNLSRDRIRQSFDIAAITALFALLFCDLILQRVLAANAYIPGLPDHPLTPSVFGFTHRDWTHLHNFFFVVLLTVLVSNIFWGKDHIAEWLKEGRMGAGKARPLVGILSLLALVGWMFSRPVKSPSMTEIPAVFEGNR